MGWLLLLLKLMTAPDLNLVQNGVSTYTIVIPVDALPAEKEAAGILQRYVARISGATLPITTTATGPTIYLGRIGDLSPLKADGYLIKTEGLNLYIIGARGKATVYGVYGFLDHYLGCRKFDAGPASTPSNKTIAIKEGLYDLQNPAFLYRESYYPESMDAEYLEWHHLHQFVDLWGVWGHSYFKFVPPQAYFQTHPEYFAFTNGRRQPTQLCLSNEAVFRLTIDYLKAQMAKHPDALYWSVSPNDDNGYCTCDSCRKADEEEGGPSGSLIRFVNRVAAAFPDKIITTLAYGYTSRAPLHTRPADNVYVMFSSIYGTGNLEAWSRLTSRLMLWNYTTQFTNYLAPFPDYANLQPNLQYARAHSIIGVFEQGSGDTYGDMSEYNSYLQAALLWNPDINVDSLTREFSQGYYGSDAVRQYLKAISARTTSLDIYGNPINESFLKPENIESYEAILDQAEAAAFPAATARLIRAHLPLEYTILQQSRSYGLDPHGYLESEGSVKPNWPARVVRFVEDCKAAGVTELSEGGESPEAYGAEWTAIFNAKIEKTIARNAHVTLANPYVEDYPAKGPGTLTDGMPGFSDFSYNWLCFYGVDMVATIDLGEPKTLNEVHMHFLYDPRHWIFLPASVEVAASTDGITFTAIGTHTYPKPEEDYLPKIDTCRIAAPVKARYLRVTAKTPQALPDWRPNASKKPMICCDEVYVN